MAGAAIRRRRRLVRLVLLVLVLLVLLAAAAPPPAAAQAGEAVPPVARKEPVERRAHGDVLVDDYAWLSNRTSPETLTYAADENSYLAETTAPLAALQQALLAEMTPRVAAARLAGPPVAVAGFVFTRRHVRNGLFQWLRDGRVVLDEAALAADHPTHFRMGPVAISPDGATLAFTYDYVGARQLRLQLLNVESGAVRDDETVEGLFGDSLEWAADARTLFYDLMDGTTGQPLDVYRHMLGTPIATDTVALSTRADPRFVARVTATNDQALLLFWRHGISCDEVAYVRADQPQVAPTLLVRLQPGVALAAVEHYNGHVLVLTNNGDGVNMRLVTAPLPAPGGEPIDLASATELVPASPLQHIVAVAVHAAHLTLFTVIDASFSVQVLSLADFPQLSVPAFVQLPAGVHHAMDWRREHYPVLRFSTFNDTAGVLLTSSLTMPDALYEYDFARGGAPRLLETVNITGYNPADYVEYRLEVPTTSEDEGWRDDQWIPVTLAFRRASSPGSTQLPANLPMLLEVFGAYGRADGPRFSAERVSLLDRGVAYAFAHVHGDGLLGPEWHINGRRLLKERTFADVAICAEYLVQTGATSFDKLALRGDFAGGLVAGVALASLRQEASPGTPMFAAVLAKTPFLDVTSNMLANTSEATWVDYERDEWGDPRTNGTVYFAQTSYDPYYRIEKLRGDLDTFPRAVYLRTSIDCPLFASNDALKMIAALRSLPSSIAADSHFVLRTMGLDETSGATPADPTGELLELSREYAFVLNAIDDGSRACEGLWCDQAQAIVLIAIGSAFFVLFFVSGCSFVIYRVMRRRRRQQYAAIGEGQSAPRNVNSTSGVWVGDDDDDDDDDSNSLTRPMR